MPPNLGFARDAVAPCSPAPWKFMEDKFIIFTWNAVKWDDFVKISNNKCTKSSKPLNIPFQDDVEKFVLSPLRRWHSHPGCWQYPRCFTKKNPLKCSCRRGRTYYMFDNFVCVCGWCCCKSVTIASCRPESFHTLTIDFRILTDIVQKNHSDRQRLALQGYNYQCHAYLQYPPTLAVRGSAPRSLIEVLGCVRVFQRRSSKAPILQGTLRCTYSKGFGCWRLAF